MQQDSTKYGTADARWAGVGPYYAMFPASFADAVMNAYTDSGDIVLDPFAGRGTAVFSAAVHDRFGIGIEINPVGWIYGQAKLEPAKKEAVTKRLNDLSDLAHKYRDASRRMPPFFHACYCPKVLKFLLAARSILEWKTDKTDRTAMALLLVNLHGKRDDSLSNQMRQTKSMSPGYAIKWWAARKMKPPDIDPLEFMTKRIAWRYAKGIPKTSGSRVYLGDSTIVLSHIKNYRRTLREGARLLLTSPPYLGITNYHYDQWLRLWLLGGPPSSKRTGGRHKGKFESEDQYKRLLRTVFLKAKPLLNPTAVIYVRTDRREPTLRITAQVLRDVFPGRQLNYRPRPFTRPTQTGLFGHAEPDLGEVDLLL